MRAYDVWRTRDLMAFLDDFRLEFFLHLECSTNPSAVNPQAVHAAGCSLACTIDQELN